MILLHNKRFRGLALLSALALPVAACGSSPFSSGARHDVSVLPSDESDDTWHVPQEAMSKKITPLRDDDGQGGHFASISTRVSDANESGALILEEGDPRRLTDLHHAPVGEVGESSLMALPGTVQVAHPREAHGVLVKYPSYFVVRAAPRASALHVPQIASQGLHHPVIAEEN